MRALLAAAIVTVVAIAAGTTPESWAAAGPESAPATTGPTTAAAGTAPASAPATGTAAPEAAAAPATAAEDTRGPLEKKVDELAETVGKMKGLKFSGYIQAQLFIAEGSSSGLDAAGVPTERDIFSIRRGRLKAAYTGIAWAELVLQIDATTRGVGLRDAEASYVEKLFGGKFKLTFGLFKVPVGFEVIESSGDRPFAERSRFWGAFIPGERDLGIRVSYEREWFNVKIAVQNGEPIGERTFPGLDVNKAKDIAGRVGLDTKMIDAGVSGLIGWGWTPPVAAAPGTVEWEDLNGDTMVTPDELIGVDPVAAADDFNWPRYLAGADLELYLDVPVLGLGALRAEFFYGVNMDRSTSFRPSTPDERFREIGWELGWVQAFGKYLYVGARVDYYDPDLSASADQVLTLTPLLMVQRESIRLVLNMDFIFDRTMDAMGELVERKNHAFTARLQVKF